MSLVSAPHQEVGSSTKEHVIGGVSFDKPHIINNDIINDGDVNAADSKNAISKKKKKKKSKSVISNIAVLKRMFKRKFKNISGDADPPAVSSNVSAILGDFQTYVALVAIGDKVSANETICLSSTGKKSTTLNDKMIIESIQNHRTKGVELLQAIAYSSHRLPPKRNGKSTVASTSSSEKSFETVLKEITAIANDQYSDYESFIKHSVEKHKQWEEKNKREKKLLKESNAAAGITTETTTGGSISSAKTKRKPTGASKKADLLMPVSSMNKVFRTQQGGDYRIKTDCRYTFVASVEWVMNVLITKIIQVAKRCSKNKIDSDILRDSVNELKAEHAIFASIYGNGELPVGMQRPSKKRSRKLGAMDVDGEEEEVVASDDEDFEEEEHDDEEEEDDDEEEDDEDDEEEEDDDTPSKAKPAVVRTKNTVADGVNKKHSVSKTVDIAKSLMGSKLSSTAAEEASSGAKKNKKRLRVEDHAPTAEAASSGDAVKKRKLASK